MTASEREREDLRDTLLSEAIAREVRNMLRSERAAVRAAVLAEAVQTAKVECSRLASEKADKECKGREGLWEMIEGEESARLSRIVLALTQLEALEHGS